MQEPNQYHIQQITQSQQPPNQPVQPHFQQQTKPHNGHPVHPYTLHPVQQTVNRVDSAVSPRTHQPHPNPLYQALPQPKPLVHDPLKRPQSCTQPTTGDNYKASKINGYKPVQAPVQQLQEHPAQTTMQYPGSDYGQHQQHSGAMLNRLQQSLSNVTISTSSRQVGFY